MPVFSSKPSVLNTACYCRRTLGSTPFAQEKAQLEATVRALQEDKRQLEETLLGLPQRLEDFLRSALPLPPRKRPRTEEDFRPAPRGRGD